MIIKDEQSRLKAIELIMNCKIPATISITDGQSRSSLQNAQQWRWCQLIAKQKGDETPWDIQAYNKLHIGVPIMREVDWFREKYDVIIKPLEYEKKLNLMSGDMFPVTRLMSKEQKSRYLDEVARYWSGKGFYLEGRI